MGTVTTFGATFLFTNIRGVGKLFFCNSDTNCTHDFGNHNRQEENSPIITLPQQTKLF